MRPRPVSSNPWAAYLEEVSLSQVYQSSCVSLRYCRIRKCRMSRPGGVFRSSFSFRCERPPSPFFIPPSSVSATHLSVASAPYVLVLHGLTRWHSLSWLIDRWPPPRPTLGISSTSCLPEPPFPFLLCAPRRPSVCALLFLLYFSYIIYQVFSSIFPRHFR